MSGLHALLMARDSRFERLALDYNSDELGEPDSEGVEEPFDLQLAQHIASHVPEADVGQDVKPYTCAPTACAAGIDDDEDVGIAIRKVRACAAAGSLQPHPYQRLP